MSHHPPVSAYHARGPSWEVQGEFEVKTKFWGKSIELLMMGCEALRLPGYENEEYRWGGVAGKGELEVVGGKLIGKGGGKVAEGITERGPVAMQAIARRGEGAGTAGQATEAMRLRWGCWNCSC